MKYFRMSYEEVVFKRSYLNILMLNRAIPSYNTEDKKENGTEAVSAKETGYKSDADFFMGFM